MLNILAAGSLTIDHVAKLLQVTPCHEAVLVRADGLAPRLIPHKGPGALGLGEKRTSRVRLPGQLNDLGLPTYLGGGLGNSLEAMARVRDVRGLGIELTALAGVRPIAALNLMFERLRVRAHFIGDADLPENLVFPIGSSSDRGVIRDPVPIREGARVSGAELLSGVRPDAAVLVLNSVKSPAHFAALVQAAGARGLPQVVTLTGSPSWSRLGEACRQDNNAAAVGNWAEWCEQFAALGQPHEMAHLAETDLSPGMLADLPARAWRLGIRGDVICTLGRSGLIVGDEGSGTAWWVGLADGALWQEVQKRTQDSPEVRNGMGDWLLGCWVAQRWANGESGGPWPVSVAAAVLATRDVLVLRGLLPPACGPEGVAALEVPVPQSARTLPLCHQQTD